MTERVRETGEFALIELLTRQLPAGVRASESVPVGIGDDAALWLPQAGHVAVITTDALVEGVHFRLDWTDWRSLGHKMLAVNLSDIAAMGAMPRLATIILGLTGEERVSDLELLYQGAGEIAAAYSVVIAGGDVVRVPHDITIGVTLIGEASPSDILRRSGAQAEDLVVVSGTLGASAAGQALLAKDPPPTAATADLLIAAHLRPAPRVALGRALAAAGVTAAMDLSDGLLGDLRKIMDASGVSAEIDVAALPILPAVRDLFPDRQIDLALRGGEDYELLLTVPPDRFDALRARAAGLGATLTPVGQIVARTGQSELSLIRDGAREAVDDVAFDHFR